MGKAGKRDHLENSDKNGWIILKWAFNRWNVISLLCLSRSRDRLLALVNAIINLPVPNLAGKFVTRYEPDSFQKRTLLRGVYRSIKSPLNISVAIKLLPQCV